MWGTVLKRDLLGENREEDKFHSIKEIRECLYSEIERQGENVVIQNIDVSLVEDLSGLFWGIVNGVKTLDLSGWRTSKVKDMSYMFYGCENLESLDLSSWDTPVVENMKFMFWKCKKLKSLDLSGWDISNVEDMREIFTYCESLKSIDISGWNTSKLYNCPATYKVVGNKIVKK